MNELLSRILEELRNAWRFRWYALAIAWLVAVGGWLLVYSLPNQYEVDARVHIDTKSAIHPLVSGLAVLPDVRQQVDLLIQTVLSRPNLEDIARRTGLDIKATTPEAEDALIDQLGRRIAIRNTSGRNINLFSISFTGSNAVTARDIVQQVINIMTGMAVGDNGAESDKAMAFLDREVERYKNQLDEIEHKLANFKKENAELMPGDNDYVTRLQSLQAGLVQLDDKLSAAKNRRDLLEQQIRGSTTSGGTRLVPPEQTRQVRALDNQIDQRQAKLDQMLTQYTEQHPDVVALKQEITRLRNKRAQTMVQLRRNPQSVSVAGAGASAELRRALMDVKVDIDSLQNSIERKQSRLAELKAGADNMTQAQAQLAELTRNYQVTKDQYDKLLTRLYSARLSGDVERSGNSLKFHVIDPPEVPVEPTGPERTLLMTVVLAGSMLAGAAFALFMSQIRPVFINRRTLTDYTGLPVLGAVTMVGGVRDRLRRQTAFLLFVAGAATLVLGYLGAVALAPIGARFVPTFLSNQWL